MKLTVTQRLELASALLGGLGVAAAALIEYLGLNLGVSSTTAAVCAIVPMVGLLGLALALRGL